MYKLYLDKQENFRCSIKISGASLDKACVRIALETSNLNLFFKGHIVNGEAIVPIKPLRGILNAGEMGTMRLEVIVDSTYVTPWESAFEAVRAVTVQASVQSQGNPIDVPAPQIDVSNVKIAQILRGLK